jgi:tRNA (uracil-5-)-methyltransferase TRM9
MDTNIDIEKQHVRNVYETIGKHFDSTRTYKWKWIEEFRSNYNSTHLLYDIGCGNGRNMGQNTIGVDTCDVFLDLCKKKQLNVVKADMTILPFQDCSADAILCIATFHHLSNNERRIQALQEMKRVLKKNKESKILLSVWSIKQPKKTRRTFVYGDNYVSWIDNSGNTYLRYYYIFDIDEIKHLFTSSGLTILEHFWDCGNEVFILQ